MKLIIQRVKSAKMSVNNNFKCEINRGIVAYLGITHEDDIKDINYCVDKLIHLRIFDDENGKLNLLDHHLLTEFPYIPEILLF